MITQLLEKANRSTKVKLFDGHLRQSVKFYGARIESVTINEDQYDCLVAQLRAAGWKLSPLVTSPGFTATRRVN